MDKRKVIAAYRRGLISLQECAQILGVENVRLLGHLRDGTDGRAMSDTKQSVR
jgi:hypothetical protein